MRFSPALKLFADSREKLREVAFHRSEADRVLGPLRRPQLREPPLSSQDEDAEDVHAVEVPEHRPVLAAGPALAAGQPCARPESPNRHIRGRVLPNPGGTIEKDQGVRLAPHVLVHQGAENGQAQEH